MLISCLHFFIFIQFSAEDFILFSNHTSFFLLFSIRLTAVLSAVSRDSPQCSLQSPESISSNKRLKPAIHRHYEVLLWMMVCVAVMCSVGCCVVLWWALWWCVVCALRDAVWCSVVWCSVWHLRWYVLTVIAHLNVPTNSKILICVHNFTKLLMYYIVFHWEQNEFTSSPI